MRHMIFTSLLLLSLCFGAVVGKLSKCPMAETKLGLVLGLDVSTPASSFCSFWGIHYGKDTSGDQRYRPPQPVEAWSGILDATKPGPICPQYPFNEEMSEDCLILNVHTPEDFNEGPLRPVLVWIHGGAFALGHGNGNDPRYILQNNVVIVSLQHRLSSFGFLNVNLPEASGNMGLKDMVLALKWVRDNIISFGGDPKKVTLFGHSSGGIAASALMLSPMAQGLFHKCFSMSGSILGYRFFDTNPEPFAFKLGIQLGLNTTDPKKLIAHIKKFTAEEVVNATVSMESADDFLRGYTDYIPFVASIDNEFEGVEAFLPEHPVDILRRGDFNRLPVMAGFTDMEGIKMHRQLSTNWDILKSIDEQFQSLIVPRDVSADPNIVAKKLRDFYFRGSSVSLDTLTNYYTMGTDSWYVHPIDYWIRLQQAAGNDQPVYYYEFFVDAACNAMKISSQVKYPGASHGDDQGYIWHLDDLKDVQESDPVCIKIRERQVQMLVNFATDGNPTSKLSDAIAIKWEPVDYPIMKHMRIGEHLTMNNYSPRRNATILWQNIYKVNRV